MIISSHNSHLLSPIYMIKQYFLSCPAYKQPTVYLTYALNFSMDKS
jgi:hypothetical protein